MTILSNSQITDNTEGLLLVGRNISLSAIFKCIDEGKIRTLHNKSLDSRYENCWVLTPIIVEWR